MILSIYVVATKWPPRAPFVDIKSWRSPKSDMVNHFKPEKPQVSYCQSFEPVRRSFKFVILPSHVKVEPPEVEPPKVEPPKVEPPYVESPK